MFLEFLKTNFMLIFEMIGFLIILRTSVSVSRQTLLFTYLSVGMMFFTTVIFNVEKLWVQELSYLSPLRPILTALVYTLQPVVLLLVMSIDTPLKKNELWILIPEIIAVPLYFTSQWTHLICWFTEPNNYQGGDLSLLPYYVFAFYLIVFAVKVYLKYRQTLFLNSIYIIVILLTATLGVVLYLITDYSNDYNGIFTTAILLYYLFHYVQMAKSDPLTGLLNRQCYYRDLETDGKKISAVASIDMNGLKWLNDNRGHFEGDRGLKTVAKCISAGTHKKRVYRVGGDEFFILYRDTTEEQVVKDIEDMRELLSKTPFVCAFGYACTSESVPPDKAILTADNAMYIDKAELKKNGPLVREDML